jgi:hypothetical protein
VDRGPWRDVDPKSTAFVSLSDEMKQRLSI